MHPYQATCVSIDGRGVLIEGPPGSGKSSVALALIDRGALLVGDDSLMLELRAGKLFALPHAQTRGLLEVRNLGICPFPVCEEAPVALAVLLDRDAPRFIEEPCETEIAGVSLPQVRLWPDTAITHLRVELALKRFGRV